MAQKPEAFFDTLTIIGELDEVLGGVGKLEIQRLAYLSCVLSLYSHCPISEWGYLFICTEYEAPFSSYIDDAINILESRALIEQKENFKFKLTNSGNQLWQMLLSLRSNQDRYKFVKTACESLILLPQSIFSDGLDKEPTFRLAIETSKTRGLLHGVALELLYNQFEVISKEFNSSEGLLTPSVVWLSYMADQNVSVRE